MVLTYLFYFFLFFWKSSDNFPLETYIKQKSTSKKVPRENWRTKNFCVLSSRTRRPVNWPHKVFCINFYCAWFLHWRVETSGKLMAKHWGWCENNEKKNGGHMRKKRKKQRNRNFPLYFKNGKLYGADLFIYFFFFLKSSDNFPINIYIQQKST